MRGPWAKIASTVSGFVGAWAAIGMVGTDKAIRVESDTAAARCKGYSSGVRTRYEAFEAGRREELSGSSVNHGVGRQGLVLPAGAFGSTRTLGQSIRWVARVTPELLRRGMNEYGAGMHWATPEERRNLGQARRKQLGRQHHDQLNIKARQSTALALLERVERGRVPALLKLKYQLMAQSPFGYFRGAAPVMAADLRSAAHHRDHEPAMRRRACAQPGRLCRARRPAGLRHQRFR